MYNIDLICIGKLKEDYLRGACAEYSKRLSAFCKLKITELTPSRIPDAFSYTHLTLPTKA